MTETAHQKKKRQRIEIDRRKRKREREQRMQHIKRLNDKEIARKKRRYSFKNRHELNKNYIDQAQYKKIYEAIVYCDDCETPSCYLCVSKWVTNEYITYYKCDKCF